MPAIQKYYPPVSDLIDASAIPGDFEGVENFVQGGINFLLGGIFYKDYAVAVSTSGDTKHYSLTLITKGLKVPLLAGMNLVFFRGSETSLSEFPIVFEWSWPLIKYVRRFQVRGFSYAPEAFVDILIELSDINSEQEFFSQIVSVFLDDGDNAFIQFFDEIIIQTQTYDNGVSGVTTEIQNIVSAIQSIKATVQNWLETTDHFTLKDIYETYQNNDVFTSAVNSINQSRDVLNNTYNVQIHIYRNVIISLLGWFSDNDEKFKRLLALFKGWMQEIDMDDIKAFLIPQFSLALHNINMALEFPRKWLVPVYTGVEPVTGLQINDPLPEPYQSALEFVVGDLKYSTRNGFEFENQSSFTFKRSMIGKTGIIVEFINMKVDLSKKYNIPEADADGRLSNFMGVYVEEAGIYFPQFWNHDSAGSTAAIKGRNLLIGTGGISGSLSLESAQQNGAALFRFGDAGNTGKHFQVGLTQFSVEFKQGAIVQSDIRGFMKIPGFKDANNNDAQIDVWAHIGNNGDFRLTASEADGIAFTIPNALTLLLKSLSIGREDNRWYIEASGSLLITASIPGVETDFLKQPIDIKKIRIWQDGSIEFVGGGITLPTQLHIRVGPVSLALTHISFTSHENVYQNQQRKYLCFGFNGALNTGPGGVAVRGDGVEFHFTRDSLPFHSYLRIAGIGVDIRIPGNASPEAADILINGYLAMRNGPDANGNVQTAGPEYQGAVGFKIKPLKIAGKGSMLMRPKVPAFIVDIELELSTPISLGATGLGIYCFRGLIGSHYVASRSYIGLSDQDSWYEYLKKKVPPTNKQGISIEKFDPNRNGFSVGIGATIGTMGDNGWTFSSKVFVLLSMPEMLLIEGQANVLHKRLGIESESDPPFYAFIVVDSNSVQAGIGVNYKLPDDGSIMAVKGEMQMGFFFGNSSAWYINIGKDMPEDKRIQARLLTLFNAYAYVMINNQGIRAGAGAKFDLQKRFGPVRVGLYAHIDARGFISFRPIQLGGAIHLAGGVYLKVGRFGIELHVAAGLSVEAPRPFVIEGYIQIKIKIVFVKIKIKLEFTWIFNKQVNTDEVKLLDPADFLSLPASQAAQFPIRATNMLSEETFVLKYLGDNLLVVTPDSSWNNFIIPVDSYIDIEFKRAVKPFKTRYGGGVNPLPQFTENVAPQKGRMAQVKHTFSVENIEIRIWNAGANRWDDYNPWEALTRAFQNAGLIVNTATYEFGYWQYNNVPGKYTSLRLLSQSPFAVSNGTPPEFNGILSQHILCQGSPKGHTCQYWNLIDPGRRYPAGDVLRDRQLLLQFLQAPGSIGYFPNPFGVDPSLKVKAGNRLEIYFKEPVPYVDLRLTCMTGGKISYYSKNFSEQETVSGLPLYEYQLIYELDYYNFQEFLSIINYADDGNPVAKVVIEVPECNQGYAYEQFLMYWWELHNHWRGDNGSLESWQQEQIAYWLSLYGQADQGDIAIITLAALCEAWNQLMEQGILNGNEQGMVDTWRANYCGRSDAANALQEISNELDNILAQPEDYPTLYLYAFRWKELYFGYLSIGGLDYCSLYLHEVCWYTEEDWAFNILLQQNNQSAITMGINSLSQAINEALPPVWRPNSSYAIIVTTKDDVHAGGATNVSSGGYPYIRKFAAGFRTAGTLGFFHQTQQAYQLLEQQNKADQYKLSGLRYYIDYQRSYPNADGKLINAKPLYYKNPKLGLFFAKPYVYEFFTKWDTYQGNPAKEYQLWSVIMDPVDKPGDPPVVPPVVVGWQVKMGQQAIPIDAFDIETISNILVQGNPNCTAITNILKPPTVIAEVQRTEIKPQKLYKAIFKVVEADTNKESMVHSYSFETSRYGSFTEHINSYISVRTDTETTEEITTHAFFPVPVGRSGTALSTLYTKLQQTITATLPASDVLIQQYASVYDRIVTGILQLEALQAATTTEFNVIKTVNTDNGATNILGILVKSPEPFNDPKLPSTEMQGTLSITDQTNGSTQFVYIFSNGNAAVFITNPALALPSHTLHITFKQVLYNGVAYTVNSNEIITVAINPGNLPF